VGTISIAEKPLNEKLTFYLRNPGIEKTTPFMKV